MKNTQNNAATLNLQRLIMLRFVIMASLTLVMLTLRHHHIPLQVLPISLAIAAFGVFNVLAWWHLSRNHHTHAQTLFWQLMGDLTALSFLFYFSGGYSNPFIWMYLIPITVAAVALNAFYAWAITAISIACYTLLMFFHVPLSHLHLHAGGDFTGRIQLDIHLVGMWLGFVVSSIIVAIFIARIGRNLREADKKIAEVREKMLESERVLALGTLAASAAHELGTPLNTISMMSEELRREYANHPQLSAELNILQTQTKRCKEILSTLTRDAGAARAESTAPILLQDFLTQAIQRWQDTRPATQLILNIVKNSYNPAILLDRTLTQAILNVLDNAADADSARVLLDAEWNKKSLTITVRDFGKGLSKEMQEKLGTPFVESTKTHGMGLGVYLTSLTLARYEGELNMKNHPDGGVITQIHLPLKHLLVESPSKQF
jgi:two-component system sensor histidine kinase RegB